MAKDRYKIEDFTDFEVGDVVAFNRSGDVVIGTIKALNPIQHMFYNRKCRVEVNAIIEAHEDKLISKVKNAGSLVCIRSISKGLLV